MSLPSSRIRACSSSSLTTTGPSPGSSLMLALTAFAASPTGSLALATAGSRGVEKERPATPSARPYRLDVEAAARAGDATAGDLSGDRFAPRDREDTLDRGGIGRVALRVGRAAQPRSHRAPRERDGCGRERGGVGGIDGAGKRIERVSVISEQPGLARDHRGNVALGDCVEQR